MNSCEFITFISAAACALAKNCDKEELSVLAVAFNQLGDSLITYLAHQDFCAAQKEKENSCPDLKKTK